MNRWVFPLLMIVCIGGFTASGAFIFHLQQLSNQVEQLNHLLLNQQGNTNRVARFGTSSSMNGEQETHLLRQEITALREAWHKVESQLNASNEPLSSDASNEAVDYAYEQAEKQQYLDQLLADAMGRGYWSHEDANIFRDQSMNLSPKRLQAIADNLIRAIEDGRLEMPDDLMMPF